MTTAADISDDERRAILSDSALRDGLRTIGRQNPYNSERLMSLEILALRSALTARDALIVQGLAVVEDFMPNVGRCVLQDFGRLNEFTVEAGKIKRAMEKANG